VRTHGDLLLDASRLPTLSQSLLQILNPRPQPLHGRLISDTRSNPVRLFNLALQFLGIVARASSMREQLKWHDEKADNSWINALAELRQRATREGHCYQLVQAITVAIDQYAEKALGNRDYFLNKPLRGGLAHMKRALMAASDAAVHYKPKKGNYRRRTMGRGFKPVRVNRRRVP
jgi:hypothetical protein